jgi:hypothetical protein
MLQAVKTVRPAFDAFYAALPRRRLAGTTVAPAHVAPAAEPAGGLVRAAAGQPVGPVLFDVDPNQCRGQKIRASLSQDRGS